MVVPKCPINKKLLPVQLYIFKNRASVVILHVVEKGSDPKKQEKKFECIRNLVSGSIPLKAIILKNNNQK